MAKQKYTNNATSKLAGSLTNVATSFAVTASEGAKFPTLGAGEWCMLNLVKLVSGLPVIEIVKATARSGDTFTVVRGQESTTATTFSAGDVVDLRITAGSMDNMAQQGGDNTYAGSNTFNGTSTFNGNTTTAGTSTFNGQINLASTQPGMDFDETDQAGAAGKWRMVWASDTWRFDKNTALARDYSTYVSPLNINSAGLVGVSRTPSDNHALSAGSSTDYGALGSSGAVSYMKIGGTAGNGSFILKFDRGSGVTTFGQGNAGAEVDRIILNNSGQVGIGRSPTDGHLLSAGSGTDYGALGNSGAISYMKIGGVSGNGSFIIKFDRTSGNTTFAQGNAGSETDRMVLGNAGLLTLNNGLTVNGAFTSIQGGALATLANNGYAQIGGSSGLNVVFDYSQIQARNNGAATTLNLNPLGGLVQAGSGGVTSSGAITGGTVTSTGQVRAQYAGGDDKILLMESATTRGYITAAAGHCFGAVNAAHTLQALICDNNGNFTAAGNITANSDERLKDNWRQLRDDFLDRLADISLVGLYDRIDTMETQIGMSAQQVQSFAPELVHVDPVSGILSLEYGKLGAVAAVLAARKLRELRAEIEQLKKGAA